MEGVSTKLLETLKTTKDQKTKYSNEDCLTANFLSITVYTILAVIGCCLLFFAFDGNTSSGFGFILGVSSGFCITMVLSNIVTMGICQFLKVGSRK